jgi:p-hydroxybenzoate 3-monooxygenase
MQRTQVAIIGAGPAGLLLGHLLHREGIATVLLEQRSRAYVEGRVRAGVLEQGTVGLLRDLGLGARMDHDGLVHTGTKISVDGTPFRIDFAGHTGGSTMIVYGQQEITRDLYEAAEARALPILFEVEGVALAGIETDRPMVRYRQGGQEQAITCDLIAGCDGFHGVSRQAMPQNLVRIFERTYPFGWLGILAEVPPVDHELIYCSHERGFALASMRSPHRSRYYLQCASGENLENWPDERCWDELAVRLGPEPAKHLVRGKSFEKSIAPLRSLVTEPMRHGRLFLAGDAAHIVPPTGAKGLNLAVSDVRMLAEAFLDFLRSGRETALDGYSARALARVWKAERFSWWFTGLTHRFSDTDPFARRMQLAELDYLRTSHAAQTVLAENYVGLPLAR